MRSFHIPPPDVLLPFVDRLWGWESARNEPVSLPTLLPGTGAELYFHYRTPFRYATANEGVRACDAGHLLCVRRKPVALCAARDVGFIAVRFRAGMLHRFTEIPGAELLDHVCSVEELWGTAGRDLADRIGGADTMAERLRLIERFLVNRLRNKPVDDVVERAVFRIYRDCSSLAIRQLADRLDIGQRQLQRRFLALTGQTPADMRRLSRFQKTARALTLDSSADGLDVALAQGYYDQSHFIRDFRELARTSPQRYLQAARAKTHFYNTPLRTSAKMPAPDNCY